MKQSAKLNYNETDNHEAITLHFFCHAEQACTESSRSIEAPHHSFNQPIPSQAEDDGLLKIT